MENFILMAVFVGLGFLFRFIKVFPAQTSQVLNMVALYVSLPAVILLKVSRLEFSADMVVPAVFPWFMLLISAILVYFVGKRLNWSRDVIAVLLLVVPIGNTSFMGIPMVNAFYGDHGIPYVIIYDQIGTMIIFAVYGSIILAVHESKQSVSILTIIKKVVLFPSTLALLAGLIFRHWHYPDALEKQLEIMAGMITPLVMMAMGFQLKIRLSSGVLRPLGFGLAVKLIIAPLSALFACQLLNLDGLAADITVFEAGMPPMVTAGALAITAGIVPELAAALVSLGMVMAFVSLPILHLTM